MNVLSLIVGIAIAVALTHGRVFAAEGADVWKAQCAKCHGETGMGDTPVGKAMKAPSLAGNDKLAGMTTADIVAAFKANKKHAALKVSDADLEATAGHVKQIAAKK